MIDLYVYGAYVSLLEEVRPPHKGRRPLCHGTRVPLASESHFVTKLPELLNRHLLGKSISYLLGPGKVFNLKPPPFYHIIRIKDTSDINVFSLVVMLCCAVNRK